MKSRGRNRSLRGGRLLALASMTMLLLGAADAPARAATRITEYWVPTPSSWPSGITAGPDGNLWFTEFDGERIGRITIEGAITEYTVPTLYSGPWGIAPGSDGNLWFTEYDTNLIGRITPGGAITEYPIPTSRSFPRGITAGPDGN